MKNPLKTPLFVALDVDGVREAIDLSHKVAPYVGGLKVGPRLLVRYGTEWLKDLPEDLALFIDNKYLDIPNTMESAVQATFDAGASFATVHAWAGPEALKRLASLEQRLNQTRFFKILVVTVLTSFSQATLPPSLRDQPIESQVMDLADMAQQCGLSGLVCSPWEVSKLRETYNSLYLVTPGVRMKDEKADDQKRIMTPKEALAEGATALVVGRPICQAEQPEVQAKRYLDSLVGASL